MRRLLPLLVVLLIPACKCIDLSKLAVVACESDGTCSTGVCCDGFCMPTCGEDAGTDAGKPRLCSPITCRGCCNGDICEIGIDPSTCGQGGQDCQSCPSGQQCQGGGCSGCNAGNCSDGCCFSGACEVPSATRCGADGGICKDCALVGGDECRGGTCLCGGNAACGLGQACVAGQCQCNAVSCPGGCCSSTGTCMLSPSTAACGTGGAACLACDATADQCVGGACQCGTGPACNPGQRCNNGTCACDPASCSGCCNGNDCLPGDQNNNCGGNGAMCQVCATTCTNKQCDGCNLANCGTGCCNAGACVQAGAQMMNQCGTGTGGEFCQTCGARADNCSLNGCRCGMGPRCAQGQRCSLGACVCDAQSCGSGCCNGTNCVGLPAQTTGQCGNGAAACVNCAPLGDNCSNGGCRCGGTSPCSPGQRCNNGVCVCDVQSCGGGCCNGATCSTQQAGTITDGGAIQCGISGNSCSQCVPGRADRCGVLGECKCGLVGAQCAAGLACVGGSCVCNASTCPLGCCDSPNGPCRVPSALKCGAAGSNCVQCDAVFQDSCVNGACSCGPSGMTCGAQTACSQGRCDCNPSLCPDGCCDATLGCVYRAGFPSMQYCGLGGTCQACTLSASEVCATAPGTCEKCEGICPAGCCFGSSCHAEGFPYCGRSETACKRCDARSDRCDANGDCACGATGPCATGEKCQSGTCKCDPSTCLGCCTAGAGACIQPPNANQCGGDGGSCTNCSNSKADRCLGGFCHCGNGPPCIGINTCQAGQCLP